MQTLSYEKQSKSETARPLIGLWHGPGLGLIVLGASGVSYTNQTGGHTCLQSTAEGWYMPLVDRRFNQGGALRAYFAGPPWNGNCSAGITRTDADFVDRLLQSSSITAFLRVDRERLDTSHDAWLAVLIGSLPSRPSVVPPSSSRGSALEALQTAEPRPKAPVHGFAGQRAILTWGNAD